MLTLVLKCKNDYGQENQPSQSYGLAGEYDNE